MSTENTSSHMARAIEHDVRNQLGNIFLAVEGIKAEQTEDDGDLNIYTSIIIDCCKQIEGIVKRVHEKV